MSTTSPTSHAPPFPSPWIVRFAPLIKAGSRVLDLAAGSGRHSRFFAARGVHVTAVDRDPDLRAGCAANPGIDVRILDLEGPWPIVDETFDAIVVVNYLHRPSLPHLLRTLRPGGVLLYETFAVGNEQFGRPSNPDFLLRPAELLAVAAMAPALTVVGFEQGVIGNGDRRAVVQRLAAVGPEPVWPPNLPA